MEIKQIAATTENVESAISKIKIFATDNGYQVLGIFETGTLTFDSKRKEKAVKKYLWKLDNKVTMAQANLFLHFLYKKVYKLDKTPRIEYSEKELKIKNAKKAWKKVREESDKLKIAYFQEKGDFYRKK